MVLLDGFLNGFSKFRFFIVVQFNLGFLSNFRKLLHAHSEHTRKRFYRTLSIRGNDFIAHWAYEERIFAHAQPAVKCEQFLHINPWWAYAERMSSLAEHTRNKFYRWLSIRGMDFIAGWAHAEMFKSRISLPNRIRFSKISCSRPLVSAKKFLKKFHACVPLNAHSEIFLIAKILSDCSVPIGLIFYRERAS